MPGNVVLLALKPGMLASKRHGLLRPCPISGGKECGMCDFHNVKSIAKNLQHSLSTGNLNTYPRYAPLLVTLKQIDTFRIIIQPDLYLAGRETKWGTGLNQPCATNCMII